MKTSTDADKGPQDEKATRAGLLKGSRDNRQSGFLCACELAKQDSCDSEWKSDKSCKAVAILPKRSMCTIRSCRWSISKTSMAIDGSMKKPKIRRSNKAS